MQIAELEYALDDNIPTQRVLRLRVGASDVSLAIDRVAVKLQHELPAPGFRKGKAPLALIRKHYAKRLEAESFSELKHDALEQVFLLLPEQDKPFVPPEVIEQEKMKLRYDRPFEFAVKYFIDPAGLSRQPEQPQQKGAVAPGAKVQHSILQGMGIPAGPQMPVIPGLPVTAPFAGRGKIHKLDTADED